MNLSDRLPSGIRRLLRLPPSYERQMRDLDEEIRFHFETHIARLVASGMSESDARAAALARFGDADDLRSYCGAIAARRERGRRLWQWIDELAQDVQFAVRQIARAPMFSATAALILALGIGANTGVFSIVHHLLLAPFPFADGNRMVTLYATSGGGKVMITPSSEMINAWRVRARTVQDIVVFEETPFVLGDSTRGPTQPLSGAAIPPVAMEFVGVRPLFGRGILATDTLADAPPVVAIGEGLWRREFGAARDVVGRTIVLNGAKHSIVGVMPEQFFIPFTDGHDAFVALRHGNAGRPTGIAKIRPGLTVDAVNREVATILPPKSEFNPYGDAPKVAREIDLVGPRRKQTILLLFGAVGIVLLIVCANVANLLLARSWNRQREFAVRVALGAGRWRIIRQLLTESVLLAAVAGALGVGFAYLVLSGIRAALPAGATDYNDVRIEQAVLLWSIGVSILTGVLFGVGPAIAAAGADASEALKAGSRTSTGGRISRRVRVALVVGEVALSVVLLAGAGLLVRTLVAISHADTGFDPRGLSSVYLGLRPAALSDSSARRVAWLAVLDGVRAIPGVHGTTLSQGTPTDFGIGMGGLEVEGRVTAPSDSLQTLAVNSVSPDYFAFTGIPIKRGRGFSANPTVSARANIDEVIINESLARRLWANASPLGARMRRGGGGWGTIVGVVGDVRLPGEKTNRLNQNLQMYTRSATAPTYASVLIRGNVTLNTLGPAVKKAIREVNPAFRVVTEVKATESMIAAAADGQRFVLRLIGAFALFAVILAAVGLHGVIAYAVNQRTREIGVRVALGAEARDVTRLVLKQGLAVAIGGVVLGVGAAVAATRTLRSFLFGVEPGDPVTLGVVGVVLLGVAILATYAPARRAARLDPVEALRAD